MDNILQKVDCCFDNLQWNLKTGSKQEAARQLLQNLQIPIVRDIFFGGARRRIFGGTPFELLYALLLGLVRLSMNVLFNFMVLISNKPGYSTKKHSKHLISKVGLDYCLCIANVKVTIHSCNMKWRIS